MNKEKEEEFVPTPERFFQVYQELCNRYGYRIGAEPQLVGRDDGTFSIIVQQTIQPIQNVGGRISDVHRQGS